MPEEPAKPDPEVLAALRQAVEAQPDSIPLRLHLAEMLLNAGADEASLGEYAAVLVTEPMNPRALQGAAEAAERCGDRSRAAGYRALLAAAPAADHAATAGQPAAAVPPEPAEPVPAQGAPDGAEPWWEAAFSKVTLKDVGGLETVKRRLQVSFLAPLRNPELREAYGQTLRGGLLLYGPPGCGKTYIARALAGELRARFLAIGLNDVLDLYLGQSEKHVHEIFGWARRNAPCVVFFDELDALGQKRIQLRHAPGHRGVVNQLLAELDGIGSANEGVFCLAATNHPWDVDSALLRPGRFDRTLLVLPPDEPARRDIVRHHLEGRPVEHLDLDRLAARTDGFSGADLAHLVKTAAEHALESAVDTGKVRPIDMNDMEAALAEIRPTTAGWFETARNVVIFANQSGMYDELAAYMKAREAL